MNQSFSTLIVIKPDDFNRQKRNYKRLVNNLQTDKIIFVSSEPIKDYIAKADLGSNIGFLSESLLIPFDDVHKVMEEHLSEILEGEPCPRGATGWYYQQFLKMQYAFMCEDEFYMVWDGDTIPCRTINMFSEAGAPYLDLKYEYHEAYFETLEVLLPGMRKCIKKSFISEHMLINTKLMRQLIEKIEANDEIEGATFWEKIIHAIPPRKIVDSAFSEFETYGTFVCFTDPGMYKLREWHSFRLGAEFFNPDEITDRDYEWLGKDFHAISFEKNQEVREDHNNLFNNPEYQSKLSARKMLEIAQEEFNGGYIEIWDDNADAALVMDPLASGSSKKSPIFQPEDEMYEKMGDILSLTNINQAYLCYEQAAFLSKDKEIVNRCNDKCDKLKNTGRLSVRKASIAIVSYNKKELLQQCIWSIEEHCAPDSYEIVVVDNASTDGVAKWLSSQAEKMTVLLSDENLGFAGGCNACIKYAPPDTDIFLLNNDTRMTHNALFWLRMGLYESNKVGATGCMANYSGNEQDVQVSFSQPSQYVTYAKSVNVPMDNPYEEKSRLCGFAMLIKREVIDIVKGLDEGFGLGYFEDDDLSLRIRQAGYQLIVCHNSFIYHQGSASFGNKPGVSELLARNYDYIKGKWGYDCLMNAVISKNEKEILSALPETPIKFLEIGCGSGNFLSMVKYRHPAATVMGIERMAEPIKYGVTEIPILLCDIMKGTIPFPEGYFDVIVVNQRDDNVYEVDKLAKILARFVVPGGQLLLASADET